MGRLLADPGRRVSSALCDRPSRPGDCDGHRPAQHLRSSLRRWLSPSGRSRAAPLTAIQYAKDKIRANSVHPGPIVTPMTERRRADPAQYPPQAVSYRAGLLVPGAAGRRDRRPTPLNAAGPPLQTVPVCRSGPRRCDAHRPLSTGQQLLLTNRHGRSHSRGGPGRAEHRTPGRRAGAELRSRHCPAG